MMCCLVSAATHRGCSEMWAWECVGFVNRQRKLKRLGEENLLQCRSFTTNPTQNDQHSTAAIQSAKSTKLPDIRIQQYSFDMCTAKLYGHCTDTALSDDTGTNTKYWKVQQLTYNGYQDLQHRLLIADRFLKRMSDPICSTATARTWQQDCHYFSLLQLSITTTVITLLAHLKLTFMANILVWMSELYNSQPALCSETVFNSMCLQIL